MTSNPGPALERKEREEAREVRTTSSTGGQKGSKRARFDLIPAVIWEVAELYGNGAEKYEDRNWERGYDWSLSYAACQRHLHQFWSGEEEDEEMALSHLACAIFHALALLHFQRHDQYQAFDDRPTYEENNV